MGYMVFWCELSSVRQVPMFWVPWSVRLIRYGHVYADITWRQYVRNLKHVSGAVMSHLSTDYGL